MTPDDPVDRVLHALTRRRRDAVVLSTQGATEREARAPGELRRALLVVLSATPAELDAAITPAGAPSRP